MSDGAKKQVCIVCRARKPLADFPPDLKRRGGHKRRCRSCEADVPMPAPKPPAPPRLPKRHYCTGCGCRVLVAGECGFCREERTGESLTEEPISPVFLAAGPHAHRLLVARLAAGEEECPNTGGREIADAARCVRGHLRTEENLGSKGKCLACERERKRAVRAAAGAQPDYGRRREALAV